MAAGRPPFESALSLHDEPKKRRGAKPNNLRTASPATSILTLGGPSNLNFQGHSTNEVDKNRHHGSAPHPSIQSAYHVDPNQSIQDPIYRGLPRPPAGQEMVPPEESLYFRSPDMSPAGTFEDQDTQHADVPINHADVRLFWPSHSPPSQSAIELPPLEVDPLPFIPSGSLQNAYQESVESTSEVIRKRRQLLRNSPHSVESAREIVRKRRRSSLSPPPIAQGDQPSPPPPTKRLRMEPLAESAGSKSLVQRRFGSVMAKRRDQRRLLSQEALLTQVVQKKNQTTSASTTVTGMSLIFSYFILPFMPTC